MISFFTIFDHYKEVLSRVLHVKESLWVGMADIHEQT